MALTVLAVTTLSDRWGLSAPLVLILVGLIGSYLPFVHEPMLSPELVLVGILPPLLYTASHNTSLVDFRANLSAIGWLSIGLVLFTALGVALVVQGILPVPFAAAFAIGAVVAPPDAVAATAVAKQIGLPRRVVTVLEGESLVNDATALVSLRTATQALVATVSVGAVLLDFGRAVLVGVGVGLLVAVVASQVLRRTTDPVATTALSFLLPFIAFAPAEELHGSGVLAVVVAGLLLGHEAPVVETAQSRVTTRVNWRTITYLLENSVFLLVGLQTRSIVSAAGRSSLGWGRVIGVCVAALLAVMVLRVVWIMATRFVVRARGRAGTPTTEAAVVAWAGMRGVVTLAAALSLPAATPHREVLVLVALVVTAGTLLIQGLTLPLVARRLGVHGPDPREDALQEATLYARAVAAGHRAMREVVTPETAELLDQLRAQSEQRVNAVWERLGGWRQGQETPSEAYRRLRTVALHAEREEVLRARAEGTVDQEVIASVLSALDVEESSLVRVEDRARRVRAALTPALPSAPCEHLAAAPCYVEPRTTGECIGCRAEGTVPVHLRLCLTCGYVGCCDSSAGRHATRHFQATGHPAMRSFEPGESWRWCYVDELLAAGQE
nr:Na+/H+ antiporter [Arsenicicoccus dermatophilus]